MKNKFLQGVTSFAVATAVCLAFGAVTASAATLKDNITIDYESQKIIVGPAVDDGSGGDENEEVSPESDTPLEDDQILFGVSTKKGDDIKTASWEVYDVTEESACVAIDISSLNTQKDNYVQIKGNKSSDPVTLYIPATDKTLKLAFDAVNATIGKKNSTDALPALEYRTQYGNWGDYSSATNLTIYQQRGATLYFRLKTDASAKLGTADDKGIYTLPSLPGKEIKVAIGKKANAPKVAVNYLKNTVTVPAKASYRINPKDGIGSWATKDGAVIVTGTKTEVTGDELAALLAGGSIDVKTAADPGKKKAESKVGQTAFNAQGATVASGVEVTAAEPKSGKVALTIKNNNADKYDIVVGTTAPTATTKVTKTLANGKSAKVSVKESDLASTKVYVRKTGVAKDAVWATEYEVAYGDGAGSVVEPTDKELLESLAASIVDETATAVYVQNQPADFLKSDAPEVKWYQAANYTVSGKELTDVTITVTAVSDTTNFAIATESELASFAGAKTPVYGTKATSGLGAFTGGAATITITFVKGEETVTKTVEVTFTV